MNIEKDNERAARLMKLGVGGMIVAIVISALGSLALLGAGFWLIFEIIQWLSRN